MSGANRGVVYEQINRLYRDGTLSGLDDGQLLERYLATRDEAAFEALVYLHGPMVLGACRRALRDPRDVEDAFQATFLILVRKAPSIRDRGLLSNWLYGVALRVAQRARSNVLKRRGREVVGVELEDQTAPERSAIGPELDQELNRLPRKYRAPLILCYLEGHTHEQAAQRLGCPVGTVRSRMARGRDLLRRRLISQGHAPTAAILLPKMAAPWKLGIEAVPPALAQSTIEAALGLGASNTFQAGAAGASALALTQGVLASMKLAQLKFVGLAVLAAGLTAGGVITVSNASPQAVKGGGEAAPAAIDRVEPTLPSKPQSQEKAPAERPSDDPTAQREKEIERKFDQFLKDIGFFGSDGSLGGPATDGSLAGKVLDRKLALLGYTQTPPQPAAPAGAKEPIKKPVQTRAPDPEPRAPADPPRRSLREIEAKLEMAIQELKMTARLRKDAVISQQELELAKGKVSLIKGTFEGDRDDLNDEIERLGLEIKRMNAEIDRASARKNAVAGVVALHVRGRQTGTVSDQVVAEAEGELIAADAEVRIKKIELEQIELRVVQLRRRLERTESDIKVAERALAATPTPAGQTPSR